MAVAALKSFAIIFNFLAFIATIIFNKEANTISTLFPRRTGEVSRRFNTEVTPAAATFAIWGLIYLFQLAWIVYSISLLFRPSAADILPTSFYVCYMLSCVFNVTWLIVWAREMIGLALAIIALITLSLMMCLVLAYTSLYDYLQTTPIESQMQTDVWYIRFLVQNGLIFYTAWVTIATCISIAIYLQAGLRYHKTEAAAISLTILLLAVLTWFALENVVFEKYTKYTLSEYIVLLIGLAGILKKNWTDGKGNQAFVLAIFVISALLFGARIMIITATGSVGTKK